MKKIGVIGFGNMGGAIVERIIAERDRDRIQVQVVVYDKDKSKISGLEGITIAEDVAGLVKVSEAIILAVKPQDFDSLLSEIKGGIEGKLIISIAAGITTTYIENQLGWARVIRAMPNLPALIGRGVVGMCKGRYANENDVNLACQLLGCISIGQPIPFNNDDMIDVVTAVSGSGPAYFCYFVVRDKAKAAGYAKKVQFIEELSKAALGLGRPLHPVLARNLAEWTVEGTISLLLERNWSCEELIVKVASKGGTTEAALRVLDNGGSLAAAVEAAFIRAKELVKT